MKTNSPLAVLADIHGNSFALEAVLADAKARGLRQLVNLGDTFYGPLDPGGTWAILKALDIPTILGNQDRILLEGGPTWEAIPTFQTVVTALGDEGLQWLESLPANLIMDDILLTHGTPKNDMAYLLEDVSTGLPAMRQCADIETDILPEAAPCSLVLSGHSHHPGQTNCNDRTLVNPGSVGLPAYNDDTPPHVMASGSPHAKYAVVEKAADGWQVEFVSVEYDWTAAAELAESNGRSDWAQWLLTGLG